MFDIMHEKLKDQVSKPFEFCYETKGQCFYDFAVKVATHALVDNAYSDEPCDGVCFQKYLYAAIAASGNKTLIYSDPYVSVRDRVDELEDELVSNRPLVCLNHLPFLKEVNKYVRTETNQCKLHQYLFDQTAEHLKSQCKVTYSTCNNSCFFVHSLDQMLEAEKKKRAMACVCDSGTKCIHIFLSNKITQHISGTACYSKSQFMRGVDTSDKDVYHESQSQSLPHFCENHQPVQQNILIKRTTLCRTPVCERHLQFLKCVCSMTRGYNKNICHCDNHCDFFERTAEQLAGRALPIANCTSHCFFNCFLEELLNENQIKCSPDCFLHFAIGLIEEDGEKTLSYPMSQEMIQRIIQRQ
jgi:hypothetical protein